MPSVRKAEGHRPRRRKQRAESREQNPAESSLSLLRAGNSDTNNNMTMEQIEEEVSNLPETQQDHLVAYVVHLRHMRDASARQDLSRRMDDRDPAHWISVDQLKEHWKERADRR
jgi:hypothetical protein